MTQRLKSLWKIFTLTIQQQRLRKLLYAAIILVSLGFIAYFLQANWNQLKNQDWHIDIISAIFAVVLYPVGMIPTVAAWHWILKAFTIRLPFQVNLRLYALSSLPKHIPGLVMYVTSRSLLYEGKGVRVGITLAAMALETVLLALCGFISGVFALPLDLNLSEQFKIIRYLVPLSAVILVVFFIFVSGRASFLDKMLSRWLKNEEKVKIQRPALNISLVWMFIAWIGGGTLLWLTVRAITPIEWHLIPTMVGIWGLAGAVSLTIGIGIQGLGLREITLGALLSMVISPLEAITAAIAFRLALTIGELLWVFVFTVVVKDKAIVFEKTSASN
jgi:Lysylphosphatidylglycerol synthase TM region